MKHIRYNSNAKTITTETVVNNAKNKKICFSKKRKLLQKHH